MVKMTEEPDDYEGKWPKGGAMLTIENRAGIDVLVMNKGAQPATEGEIALFAEVVRLRAYIADLAAAPAEVQQAEPVAVLKFPNYGGNLYTITFPRDLPAGEHPMFLRPPPAEVQRLRDAAQAVVDRWDTPKWKDEAPTADVINALRRALEGGE